MPPTRRRGRLSAPLPALLMPALVLAACAGPSPEVGGTIGGIGRAEGGLGWGGFSLGMSLREAERRAGTRLELREIEDDCGEWAARTLRRGQEIFLGFTGKAATATLHTLVIRLPPGVPREEAVGELKRRLPGLRYRPSPQWPGMPEEENPKPLYVHGEHPEQGILVGVEEGWLWISFLHCMD